MATTQRQASASSSASPAAARVRRSSSRSPTRVADKQYRRAPVPLEEILLHGAGRMAGRTVLPPRALHLPVSKDFVEDLCEDVEELLDAFAVAWQEQCAPGEEQSAPAGPCQVFAETWEEKGWDAAQFTWGESKPTRAAFWTSTVRAFTETLKPLLPYIKPPSAASTNTEEIPFELLLRGAGVLLALYVLCATTDESVRILPSLEPGTSPEEPADEEEIGWMIEIEADLYAVLLQLPALAGAYMDESTTDINPAPSADLHYALAALHGLHAPRRVMKMRAGQRVFAADEWIRTKPYREKPAAQAPLLGGGAKKGRGRGGKAGAASAAATTTAGKKGRGKAKADAGPAPIVEKTLPPISAFILLAPTTYNARPLWPSNELATRADVQRQAHAWGWLVETPPVSSASINMHAADGAAPPPPQPSKPVSHALSRAELVMALLSERLGASHYLPPSIPSPSSSARPSAPTQRALSIKLPPRVPARLAYRAPAHDAADTLIASLAELEREREAYAAALRQAVCGTADDAANDLFGLDDDEDGADYLGALGAAQEGEMDEDARKLREEITREARSRTKAAVAQGRKKQRTA